MKKETLNNLKIAEKAVKTAGEYLKNEFKRRTKIISALKRDIKLKADIESERLILKILNENTDYPILSEEIGLVKQVELTSKEKHIWIVDPLDGSMNFSRRVGVSCISIALFKNDKPVLGVIYDFNRDELFTGVVNEGAWLNGKKIRIGTIRENSNAILATGFPVNMQLCNEELSRFIEQIKQYKKIRMIGSAALSMAYVACGRFDIYHENNINIWDVAAGIAIVQSAGGVTNTIKSEVNSNHMIVYGCNNLLSIKENILS